MLECNLNRLSHNDVKDVDFFSALFTYQEVLKILKSFLKQPTLEIMKMLNLNIATNLKLKSTPRVFMMEEINKEWSLKQQSTGKAVERPLLSIIVFRL